MTHIAAAGGDTEGMLEMGEKEWHPLTTRFAAEHGHTQSMIEAVKHGCPWNRETIAVAAWGGYTETMIAAIEEGQWDPDAAMAAAIRGNTKTMTAAFEKGCLSNGTASAAAINGHTQTMEAAVKEQHKRGGCSWHPQTIQLARIGGHWETAAAAKRAGCPE